MGKLLDDERTRGAATTYAGSEMTTIYGITDAGLKKTGRDDRVLPRLVIYDPELTLGLSVATSVTSGINAIAHAAAQSLRRLMSSSRRLPP